MPIKKITIIFTKPKPTKPKQETFMFNIIEKFLKSFFRQVNNLSRRDQAEILRLIIILATLVVQPALFMWILLDKAR